MKKEPIALILANNFQREILDEKKPVLVLCSDYDSDLPAVLSVLDDFTRTLNGGLKVGVLAEEFTKPFQESFRVIGTPTFLLFDQGRERGRLLGQTDTATLTDWMKALEVFH